MNEFISFNESLLDTLGIFNFGKTWSSYLKFIIFMITMGTFYATSVADLLTTLDDFSLFAENFASMLIGFAGFMKYFCLIYNRKKVRNLRHVVKWVEVSGQELEIDDRSIVDNYDQDGQKFSKNYAWTIYGICQGMLLYVLPGVFLGYEFQLPFPAVYPFDVNSNALFIVTYVHQAASCYIFVLIYVAHDTWFMAVVNHACGHFCLLQNLLEEIADANLEPEQIRERIATCVRLHQNVYKFSDDIEQVFNVSNFMHFFITSVGICISGYEVMTMGLKKPQLLVKHLPCVGGQILQLFIFNWCGQQLEEKSTGVAHAISRSSLYKLKNNHQKDLGLILLRAQRPTYLTTCGFTNLSLENFTDLMKTSMSYFTMLRSVQESE